MVSYEYDIVKISTGRVLTCFQITEDMTELADRWAIDWWAEWLEDNPIHYGCTRLIRADNKEVIA